MDVKKTILVVLPVGGRLFAQAIEQYVEEHDLPWNLVMIDQPEWGASGPSHDLSEQRFDAMMGWISTPILDWWAKHNMPAVMWGLTNPGPGTIACEIDNRAIGVLAARHFRDQGVRCVATVRRWNFPGRHEQFEAFLAEAARLGLETLRYEPRTDEDLDADAQDAALAAWLRAAPHPIGVHVHQDRDAFILLRTCRTHGLRVPDEVAVLGVDDEPMAALAQPPLSSVELPLSGIAARMALAVQHLLSGTATGGTTIRIAPLRVRARASTGPFRSRDPLMDRLRTRMASTPGRSHRTAALAASVGLSAVHMHRRFLAATGTTPGVFLRQRRLAMAQDLLATTDLTMTAIAKRCGLGSSTALWIAFKVAGLPAPATWRNLQRGLPPTDGTTQPGRA